MCASCAHAYWCCDRDEGKTTPVVFWDGLPVERREVVKTFLGSLAGVEVGSILHVQLDDDNYDIDADVPKARHLERDYTPDELASVTQWNALSLDERAYVVGKYSGYAGYRCEDCQHFGE